MVVFGSCGRTVGFAGAPFMLGLSLAFGLAVFAAPTDVSAADIAVQLDQAKLANLPEKVATIVIGNPLIADITMQAGGLMVVTGKAYGTTNIIALDRGGAVLMEKSIQVQEQRLDTVVVYRGLNRESYSCTPNCTPRITLGDVQPFFQGALAQSTARSGNAQSAGTPK